MCRLLLDAALKAALPGASYGETSGSTDLTQAVVLLHSAGEPLRPFDRFESGRASRFTGRAFAEWESACCGPDRTKTWPVPNSPQWQPFRRWASLPRTSPTCRHERTDPGCQRGPASGDCPRWRRATITCVDFVGRCALAVPVLDGGALWREPAGPGRRRTIMRVLSGGLSVSLLQLEADGFMTMKRPRATLPERPHPPTPARQIGRSPGRHSDLGDDAASGEVAGERQPRLLEPGRDRLRDSGRCRRPGGG